MMRTTIAFLALLLLTQLSAEAKSKTQVIHMPDDEPNTVVILLYKYSESDLFKDTHKNQWKRLETKWIRKDSIVAINQAENFLFGNSTMYVAGIDLTLKGGEKVTAGVHIPRRQDINGAMALFEIPPAWHVAYRIFEGKTDEELQQFIKREAEKKK